MFEVVCEVMKTWVSLANKVMSDLTCNPQTSLTTYTCHAHHLSDVSSESEDTSDLYRG